MSAEQQIRLREKWYRVIRDKNGLIPGEVFQRANVTRLLESGEIGRLTVYGTDQIGRLPMEYQIGQSFARMLNVEVWFIFLTPSIKHSLEDHPALSGMDHFWKEMLVSLDTSLVSISFSMVYALSMADLMNYRNEIVQTYHGTLFENPRLKAEIEENEKKIAQLEDSMQALWEQIHSPKANTPKEERELDYIIDPFAEDT